MKMMYHTERLDLQVLNASAYKKVLRFYEENKLHFEPWEAKRTKTFYTNQYHEALLDAEYNQILKGNLLRLYVFLKENKEEIIGTVSLNNIQRGPFQTCTIGYKVHRRFCNQGIGKEMIQKALKIALDDLKLHRIEALVHPLNILSIKLLESTHFEREGTAREAAFFCDSWQDMYRYAFIADGRM
ncbi:MAG: GNAT family N-acetyltransferase [Lachnospiraceae bacterium]|nr:GNAT family N-acetyltransferase [Lachnospiraceae bacterium]